MIDTYFGLDVKKIGLFAGLVLATTVVVTLIFGLIFGFDRWRQNMRMSSQLMTAASLTPVGAAPGVTPSVAGQFVCPQHGAIGLPQYDHAGVPHCPLDGQVMVLHSAGNMALAAGAG